MVDRTAALWRQRCLDWSFKVIHLLPELSIEENVALPQMLLGVSAVDARKKAANLCEQLVYSGVLHKQANFLGANQRAVVARAIE